MRRHTILVPVLVVLGSLVDPAHGWSKDGFIDSVLSQYRETDQAGRADSARDGIITEGEFVFSLYGQADARGNNDNQVSREEFLDYYSQLFNISSELATIMFDYLNDPASRDDVITTSDVSLSSFAGRTYATVAEYKDGLEKVGKLPSYHQSC
ncbi:hypothetical protein ElyMa_002553200 [Elysia marginata]|uniref:EF-hand domain-containing protein n=1 Tax=Elysia marginata TaxID=1093978 RepID=A0AAV4GWF5_9GAST|nr:hypothetical protein ElyMa_002553200 [Elysia marginata]